MLNYFEDDEVVYEFTTNDANDEPVAPSAALAAADFKIIKLSTGDVKATTNGVVVTSPLRSTTGLHKIAIDTSNNTGDSGFWVTGERYRVEFNSAKTIDTRDQTGVTLFEFGIEFGYVGSSSVPVTFTATFIEQLAYRLGLDGTATAPSSSGGNMGVLTATFTGDLTGKVLGGGAGTITGTGVQAQLPDGAITAAKIASDAITSTKVADGTLTAAKIGADAITAAKIADNAFSAEHFAADSLNGKGDWGTATVTNAIKAVTDKLDTGLEADGASGYQWTALALENGPSGTGGGDATEANQTTIISTLETIAGYIDTEVAAIKAVTDKLDTALEDDGSSGYQFTTLALENGPSGGGGGDATEAKQDIIIAALAVVDGIVDTIVAKTNQMVFTTANQLDVQVISMATDSLTADAAANDFIGAAEIAAGASQEIADLIAADWIAGDASPLAIVAAIKADPTLAAMIAHIDADISSLPLAGAIADAILDEAVSGHTTAGTTGAYLTTLNTMAGKFTGLTSVPSWLRALARNSTPDSTALSEINNSGGTYDPATDSLEQLGTIMDDITDQDDEDVYQLNANSLENAPTGKVLVSATEIPNVTEGPFFIINQLDDYDEDSSVQGITGITVETDIPLLEEGATHRFGATKVNANLYDDNNRFEGTVTVVESENGLPDNYDLTINIDQSELPASLEHGDYEWDIEVKFDDNKVRTYLWGNCRVRKSMGNHAT